MRRIVFTVLITLLALGATAAPAAAHGIEGAEATNYRSEFRELRPAAPGIEFAVIEAGARVELRNTTSTEVLVLGYQDEPYLRVGPEGVFENRRSPTTYLNLDRQGGAPIPGDADPSAEPEWQRVSGGDTARWHDHRAHWMGAQDPPAVRADRTRQHMVIPQWEVPMRHGEDQLVATGRLLWVPPPSATPWLLLAGAALLLGLALALGRWWAAGLAAGLVVLLGLDITHALGVALARGGGTVNRFLTVLAGSAFSIVAWGAGIIAVVMLARRRVEGLVAGIFAAVLVAAFGALPDLGYLSNSQIPFAFAGNVGRFLVATTLGLGFGLGVGGGIRLARMAPWREAYDDGETPSGATEPAPTD